MHTDFTKESGPSVLPHVLGGSHLRPAQRKAQKALLDETMGGEIRKNSCISVGFPWVFFASVPSLSCQRIFFFRLHDVKLNQKRAVFWFSGRYRYCFLNVWRSVDTERPVSEWPLALLHPRSCNPLKTHRNGGGASYAVKSKKHVIYPANCAFDCMHVPAQSCCARVFHQHGSA